MTRDKLARRAKGYSTNAGGAKKPHHHRKTPLDSGEVRTQILADSIHIAASAVNLCTKYTDNDKYYFIKDIYKTKL